MIQEKVNQVIRCVKECWWRVGVVLVILLGFTLIAIHGWPQDDWGFGWGAVGALGTIFTGGVALNIAYAQKKSNDERIKNSEWIVTKSVFKEINRIRDCVTEIMLAAEILGKAGIAKERRLLLVDDSLRKAKCLKGVSIEANSFSNISPELVSECYAINEEIEELNRELHNIDLSFIFEKEKGEILVLRNIVIMLKDLMEGTESIYELSGFQGAKGSYAARLTRALEGLMRQSGIQHPLPESLVVWDARLLDGWVEL